LFIYGVPSLDLISILDIVRDQVGLINFAGRMKIPASMDKLLPFLWIYLGSSSDPAQAICDVPVHGYHGFAGDGYALTSESLFCWKLQFGAVQVRILG
jgi:hypothetical protein